MNQNKNDNNKVENFNDKFQENNFNQFTKENEIKITTIEGAIKFLNELDLFILKNKDKEKSFFFRGHAKKEWKLESKLRRMTKYLNEEDKTDGLVQLQKSFIDFYKKEAKGDYDDLHILTEMHYHGTPTMLIDFTSDILQALRFAIADDFDVNFEEKIEDKFFSLFIIEFKISKMSKKTLNFYENDFFVFKEPNSTTRSISQTTYFVLDNNTIENNYKKISFSYEIKEELIKFLLKKEISSKPIYLDGKENFQYFIKNSWISYFLKAASLVDDNEKAIKLYEKVIKLNPNFFEAYYNLGVLYEKQEEKAKALRHYLKAIELNPSFSEVHCNLGNLYEEWEITKEAEKHYLKVAELNPNCFEVHCNLGNLYSEQGRNKEAEEHYLKTIELNPNFFEAHYNLGILYEKLGRNDEAEGYYQKAIEINPDFSEVHYDLGVLYENQGKDEDAKGHYLKAIDLNPEFFKNNYNLKFYLQNKKTKLLKSD